MTPFYLITKVFLCHQSEQITNLDTYLLWFTAQCHGVNKIKMNIHGEITNNLFIFQYFFSLCSPSTLLNLQVWQSVWLNWYYLSPGGSPGHCWRTVPLIIFRWSSRDWYHEQSLPASYHYYGPSTWISSQMCGVGNLENCIIGQHKIKDRLIFRKWRMKILRV